MEVRIIAKWLTSYFYVVFLHISRSFPNPIIYASVFVRRSWITKKFIQELKQCEGEMLNAYLSTKGLSAICSYKEATGLGNIEC